MKIKHLLGEVRWRLILKISLMLVGAGVLAVTAIAVTASDHLIERTQPQSQTGAVPALKFKESPLTGRKIAPELASRPVYAAMIENSFAARPQSSFADAGIIFEARVEGGITRFMALYQESSPQKIGPIRSLRPYYIDWLLAFDPAVLHVGGSTEAKSMVASLGVKSLDVSGAYYRVSDRAAPHNAYSSYERMSGVAQRLGYTSSKFTPIKRRQPQPLTTPTASTISIDISGPSYNVTYRYDQTCNCYQRNMAGDKHIDRETGKQLSPDVVVVMQMAHSIVDSVGHVGMATIGSGKVWIFQDGSQTTGTWRKDSRKSQLRFFDQNGKEIGLNPGQAWITVIPTDRTVTVRK